jgi:multisubunit Na+/H+ antiporter MnhB subunit
LTSKPQGGVIGFALEACVLVFSMFQTRVDPVTFAQLGD